MSELCKKLKATTDGHTLRYHADPMLLSADHAIPLGLLINELVTNAVKYAYPERGGVIEVNAREIEGHLHVEVSDQGIGLPDGFDRSTTCQSGVQGDRWYGTAASGPFDGDFQQSKRRAFPAGPTHPPTKSIIILIETVPHG